MVGGCDNLEYSGPSVFDTHLIKYDNDLRLTLSHDLRGINVDNGAFYLRFKIVEGTN